jgi:hypothetical protein
MNVQQGFYVSVCITRDIKTFILAAYYRDLLATLFSLLYGQNHLSVLAWQAAMIISHS